MFFLCFDFVLLLYSDIQFLLQISSVLLCIHPSSHNSDIVYISFQQKILQLNHFIEKQSQIFAQQFPQTLDYFSALRIDIMTNIFFFLICKSQNNVSLNSYKAMIFSTCLMISKYQNHTNYPKSSLSKKYSSMQFENLKKTNADYIRQKIIYIKQNRMKKARKKKTRQTPTLYKSKTPSVCFLPCIISLARRLIAKRSRKRICITYMQNSDLKEKNKQ